MTNSALISENNSNLPEQQKSTMVNRSNAVIPVSVPRPLSAGFSGRFRLKPIVTPEELQMLNAITSVYNFEFGVQNWSICHLASPDGFNFVIDTENGSVAALYTKNTVARNLIYGHDLVVLPQYRGKGIASMVYDSDWYGCGVNQADNKNQLLMGTLKKKPFIIGHKLLEYMGVVDETMKRKMALKFASSKIELCRLRDPLQQVIIDVQQITEGNPPSAFDSLDESSGDECDDEDDKHLHELLKYDRELYEEAGINAPRREAFIKAWASAEDDENDDVITIVAYSEGICAGYGIARKKADDCYMICPVYANSDKIGKAILYGLVRAMELGAQVQIEFPATNQGAMEFCYEIGLEFSYAEMRTWYKRRIDLPLEKIFAHHDFWPL